MTIRKSKSEGWKEWDNRGFDACKFLSWMIFGCFAFGFLIFGYWFFAIVLAIMGYVSHKLINKYQNWYIKRKYE